VTASFVQHRISLVCTSALYLETPHDFTVILKQ